MSTAIEYLHVNPDGTFPPGWNIIFTDTDKVVGKTIEIRKYSQQLKRRYSCARYVESHLPFRPNIPVIDAVYYITKKAYDSMISKPPLKYMSLAGANCKGYGWVEEEHTMKSSRISYFFVNGIK